MGSVGRVGTELCWNPPTSTSPSLASAGIPAGTQETLHKHYLNRSHPMRPGSVSASSESSWDRPDRTSHPSFWVPGIQNPCTLRHNYTVIFLEGRGYVLAPLAPRLSALPSPRLPVSPQARQLSLWLVSCMLSRAITRGKVRTGPMGISGTETGRGSQFPDLMQEGGGCQKYGP